MVENGGDIPPPPGVEDDVFHDAQPGVQQQQQQFVAPPFAWPPQFFVPPPWFHQQPPRVQEPRPDRVKLGPFLQSRPSTWFNLAEASCARNFVVTSRDMYFTILSSLPDEVVRKLGTLADSPDGYVDPYLAVKNRVLQLYAPTVWEDLNTLLHFKEMANLRPSALMTEMLSLLPNNEQPGMLFKALYLSRLPADVRGHVQLQADTLDCVQIGELADKAWLARVNQQSHVLAALPPDENLEELADTVAALNVGKSRSKHVQPKKRTRDGRPPPQQRQGQQERQPKDICSIHLKHGGKAHFCREPKTCILATKVTGNAEGQDW